jgi:hypothetical protein
LIVAPKFALRFPQPPTSIDGVDIAEKNGVFVQIEFRLENGSAMRMLHFLPAEGSELSHDALECSSGSFELFAQIMQ